MVSSKKSKELRSGLGIFSTQQRGVDGKYRCQHCLQPFRFRSRMLKHIRDEHGKRYVCEECDAGFQFKAHLAQHIKDDHPELEARHPCPECQMTFKNKNRLEVHQKTEHFGEKGHCGVCNVTGLTQTQFFYCSLWKIRTYLFRFPQHYLPGLSF